MEAKRNWALVAISDADEPGVAVMTGIRHRDFDDVMIVLLPDGEQGDMDWYGIGFRRDGKPVRPLLLFYKGSEPAHEEATVWAEQCIEEGEFSKIIFPDSFTPIGESEVKRDLPFYLTIPPFPWLDEAKLGMEMGKYFNDVELINWNEPTATHPGYRTFRFFLAQNHSIVDHSSDIPIDLLPF